VRTYGTATLQDGGKARVWVVKVEPHVAMRLKRAISKLSRNARGDLILAATEENARDLEWFAERYPIEFDPRDELERAARAYDRRRQVALDILSGSQVFADLPMALPPREYQRIAAELVKTTGGLILADEVGLGKTVSAIATFADTGLRPALVVVQTHLQRQWKAEIERFLPFSYVHIAKKGTPYDTSHHGRSPDVLILTYHKLHGWAEHLAGRFPSIVFDEVQELRHRKDRKRGGFTRRWAAARMVTDGAKVSLGLSATPIYNYGDEFFSVAEVLAPGALGEESEFRQEWCRGYGDKWIITNPRAFGSYLRESGLLLRRTRQEVGRELPSLTTVVHEIESSDDALEPDVDTLAHLILSDGRGIDKMQAAAQFDMRMRQATGIAKAPYVAAFVRLLIEQGPVVLFGWHRLVYDAWGEQLRDLEPAWFTGHESPVAKSEQLQRFVSGKTNLLIMSLRAGSGVDGIQKVCSQVVIGELDWSPGVHTQCIGRAHRDGQKSPVFAYYMVSDRWADPVMVDVLDLKRTQLNQARDPDAPLTTQQVDPHHVKRLAEAYLKKRGRRPSGAG